jgi:hypothetical protein
MDILSKNLAIDPGYLPGEMVLITGQIHTAPRQQGSPSKEDRFNL